MYTNVYICILIHCPRDVNKAMLKLKETIKCLKFAKTSLAETGLITESFMTYLTKKKNSKTFKRTRRKHLSSTSTFMRRSRNAIIIAKIIAI